MVRVILLIPVADPDISEGGGGAYDLMWVQGKALMKAQGTKLPKTAEF